MNLKNINEKMLINVSKKNLWGILSQYGDVSDFHAGVFSSHSVEGNDNHAINGCERVCNIVDMGIMIQLKERIIDFTEGVGYQYEVYEWKNFPLKTMLFKFTIIEHNLEQSFLRIDIDYKAKPAFLTPLMAGKMGKLIHGVLLGYKHYAETGEKKIPIKKLLKKYTQTDLTLLQTT